MLSDVTRARARRGTIAFVAVVFAAAIVPFHLVAQGPVAVTAAAAAQTAAPGSAAPAQVRPVQPASPVPQVVPPKEAAPVRGAQAPADKRPASPSAQAADDAQIRAEIDEQRARVRETERALNKMRLALEELLAQQARLSVGADSQRQVEAERVAEDFRRRAEELRRVDVQRTDQFLQEQLRALTAEQEKMRGALQTLSDQIEQIRKHIEKSSEAERLVNPR